MARSVWKGPYINSSLLTKKYKMMTSGKSRDVMHTWSRASIIPPQLVGSSLNIYNGRDWTTVSITEQMVGHKIGEFVLTRKIVKYLKKNTSK